jgi:hypothetical protein
METLYNLDKTPSAEPSLKGNIVPDAKRSENFTSLPGRAQPDSLWRHLPYSSVLQKTEIEMVFAKTGSFPSAIQLLPYLNNPMNMHPKERWIISSKISKNGAIINFHHFAKFLKNGTSESSVF